MKEAAYYKKLDKQKVECTLCPHNCVIGEGKTGYCGVRKNISGKLYALTYGKVASIALDPIEKKPLYHFYPGERTLSLGTFGCNLHCKHCQNWQISHRGARENDPELQSLSPGEAVELAKKRDCRIIVFTYNEPSIWFEYILETGKLASKENIFIVLVTAGLINPEPLKELIPYIDAYRLDIKGFNEDFYKRLTGNRILKDVLSSALIVFEAGIHIEIITNIIPGWNDSDDELNGLSKWIVNNMAPEIPWHVTAYHPYLDMTAPSTPVSTLERAKKIGQQNGLKFVYIGNVPGHHAQNTICPKCLKTLISRIGFGTVDNKIKNGKCMYCGYEFKMYRD